MRSAIGSRRSRRSRPRQSAWLASSPTGPAGRRVILPFCRSSVADGLAGGNANPAAWAASAAANNTAWSAGFISFVVQQAATAAGMPSDPFGRSTLHANYIRAAKQNRINKNFANPFWLFRLDEVKPEAGDFLCKNRPGVDDLTFDNIPSVPHVARRHRHERHGCPAAGDRWQSGGTTRWSRLLCSGPTAS